MEKNNILYVKDCNYSPHPPTHTHTSVSAFDAFQRQKKAYELEGQVFGGINEERIFLELTAELSAFFYIHLHFQQKYLIKTLHASSCCLCSTESNVLILNKQTKKKFCTSLLLQTIW